MECIVLCFDIRLPTPRCTPRSQSGTELVLSLFVRHVELLLDLDNEFESLFLDGIA